MAILILFLVGIIGTSAGHGSEPKSSDVKSRFVISPQPASPQFVNSILELLSRLPFNLYNNYICNVYAGVYSTPYFYGYPYAYYYYSRGRREAYSTYEMYQYSKTVKGTFKILSSYWNRKELKSLYDEVREIATEIMSRRDQKGPTVAETTRRVLKNYLSRNRVSLSIDDVHNAIVKINTTPKRIFRSSVNYYVRSSCSAVRSNSYCNYVRHMTTSGICSTVYFSNLMLNQCCESNTTTGVVTTASTTSVTTASTSSSSITTTTSSGVTTTASTKECGVSKLNPAVRVGGRQKASARFLNFLSMMNELRIVGGVPTDKCEYPWVVRLQVDQSICAGSIIDETHILSAGHCFGSNTKPSGVTVIAGDHNYDIKDTNEVEVPVSKIDIHPQYKDLPDGTVVNDMAILTLSKPLTFNDCIGPICLPSAGDSSKLDNTDCTVAGWGTTSFGGSISPVLQEVTVPTYSGQKCKDAYNASLPSNTAVQICAGGPGVDSCQGDSGGPLFCPVNGQYVQYGIVSYGDGCGVAGSAAVYTDVSALLDFIQSKTSTRRYDILNSYYPYFMAKKFRG